MINNVKFVVGPECLAGHIVRSDARQRPTALFLHGAGEATKEKALPIAEYLADSGIASFGFDFSGHGQSSGQLASSSLKKRTAEATAALHFLDSTRPVTLFGFSMGGHIALELLALKPIANLILFYPALYAQEAFGLPFGPAFSQAIRQEKSWETASVLSGLREFTGNLLIVIGGNDKVIPKEVIAVLDHNSPLARSKEVLTIPEAGHQLIPFLMERPALFEEVASTVTQFISPS